MPSKSEEYLAKAKECEKRANNIRDLETKSQWLNLAQQWRELAENPVTEDAPKIKTGGAAHERP
jgi:hypothetical protein